MELNEAIKHLKMIKNVVIPPTDGAIRIVLKELDRLKSDLYSANCIIEDLLNNKKWKSVNDELPEEETKVLICSNFQDIQQNIQLGYIYNNIWYTWEKNEVIDFVSYWMELPESPKEEK